MTTERPSNLTKINPTSVSERIKADTWKKHKPRGKEFFIRCEEIKGFYIRKRPISSRHPQGLSTYYVNGRFAGTGKQIYPKIGGCSIVPFDKAVETARDWLYKISQGIDPRISERKEKAFSITLEEAIQEYLDGVQDDVKEGTYKDYARKSRIQLKNFQKKAIGEITVEDVKQWWLKGDKKSSMKNALTYASIVLDDYVAEEYIEFNPFRKAKLLKRVNKTIKKSNATIQHVPMENLSSYVASMYKCWEKQGEATRDLVLFLLLTGKRIDEASRLTWKNVNLKKGELLLLEETTKGESPEEIVPTTPYIHRLLKHRQENCKATGNPYVFNADRKQDISKNVHVKDTRRVLKNIWNGIPEDERPRLTKEGSSYIANHDLRRTFGTAQGELGYSKEVRKDLLGHKKQDMTDKYTERSTEYKRQMIKTVQEYMNTQSHDGIHALLVKFYGASKEHFHPEEEGAYIERNFEKLWDDF
jgi:integrase